MNVKTWLNNPLKLGNYRPYSSAGVSESSIPLTKKLPWAKIKLAIFRLWVRHCTTEPPAEIRNSMILNKKMILV